MENIDKAIELNIESWNKAGYPIPETYKQWCMEHGREDLLGEISAESAFLPLPSTHELAEMLGVSLPDDFVVESRPTTESDMDSMIDLAIEQWARDLGIEIPEGIITGESSEIDKNGELPTMEEIFGMKLKE